MLRSTMPRAPTSCIRMSSCRLLNRGPLGIVSAASDLVWWSSEDLPLVVLVGVGVGVDLAPGRGEERLLEGARPEAADQLVGRLEREQPAAVQDAHPVGQRLRLG